jgi:rod shape-determining protein MreD
MMKILRIVILCCITVALYSALNMTPHRWLFLPIIVVLLLFVTSPARESLIAAACMGFFYDLLAFHVGPYMLMFCLIILVLQYLRTSIITSQTFLSRIILLFIGLLLFMSAHVLFQWFTIGPSYIHMIRAVLPILAEYCITMFVSTVIAYLIIRVIQLYVARYAR